MNISAIRTLSRTWPVLALGLSSALLSQTANSQANIPATIQAEAYSHMNGIQLENTSDTDGFNLRRTYPCLLPALLFTLCKPGAYEQHNSKRTIWYRC